MSERPQVRSERTTDTYAIAIWERLVVWVVDGQTPADELERLRERVVQWGDTRGRHKNVVLIVLHATPSTMSPEERRPVLKMIEETKHDRVASATVVLARGIIGALHRSILTAFSLVVPPPHPTKVFAELRPALEWLHPFILEVCPPIDIDHLEAVAAELHAEILAAKAGG